MDAAINCNLNKIQCGKCEYDFCNKCKTAPYHIGYTCELYKEYVGQRKCRVCHNHFKTMQTKSTLPAFDEICNSDECMLYIENACSEINKKCIHPCYGAKCKQNDEDVCIPCLHTDCVKKDEKLTLGLHIDEYCMICYTDSLGQAPSVQLNCKHVFHYNCLNTILTNKWNGSRIHFGFLDCPACA